MGVWFFQLRTASCGDRRRFSGGLTRRARKTEVFAQRFTRVLMAEDTPLPKERDDGVDKYFRAGREVVGHEIKPIGGASEEPFSKRVGNLFRRTDDKSMTAADTL